MNFISLGIGFLIILLGLIIHLGKKHNLIAGYNTMDKDEKEAFDIIIYARHFGLTFLHHGYRYCDFYHYNG